LNPAFTTETLYSDLKKRKASNFLIANFIVPTAIVELKNISKAFSGVKALSNVSLKIYPGECLGLVGENGAGKSTLMKILSGVWPVGTYSGEMIVDGRLAPFEGPKQASDAGVSIIHQELSLFQELSIAENIFLGEMPSRLGVVRGKELLRRTQKILDKLKFPLSPEAKVKTLSVGERQLVEIARAFRRPVKVLIFDEPTSALTDREIDHLFELIHELKTQGVACVYITHKLPEIHELCDRVTVLRDGQTVADFEKSMLTDEAMIEAMVGRKIDSVFPPKRPLDSQRAVELKVENLSYRDRKTGVLLLNNVSFEVRKGEIFGIAGLMGSRRTELLLSIFGSLDAERISGTIWIGGKEVQIHSPIDAIQNGIGLVTEDRKVSGLVLEMDVKSNLTLPILRRLSRFLTIRGTEERDLVDYYIKVLRIKTPNLSFKVRNLSGGNQQKVIIGRWLSTKPKILLLDEPTRGIDVMAKAEIYYLMRQLVDQGLTLILVSSELPEVVSLSDRVLVMREGRVAGLLSGGEMSQKSIMEKAAA